MAARRWSPWYLVGVVVVGSAIGVGVLLIENGSRQADAQIKSIERLDQIPFDGARAFEQLKKICEFGARPSGSEAMTRQQAWLTAEFQALGATVTRQEFSARHPLSGQNVTLANLIITWHPERRQRYLLAAHYDTRPFPDRDPVDPRGVFVGANDGASGVALLLELGRHMPGLVGKLGVDFVLFDGEELVYDERVDPYFLGSKHFAQQYARDQAARRQREYRGGVLLDMVADVDLELYLEGNSVRYAGRLANEIWLRAERLGVRNFVRQVRHTVNDDHIPLNEIARIPTCDLIDFDYPYWHTTQDAPERCSALSLAKVGWVVHEWLKLAVR